MPVGHRTFDASSPKSCARKTFDRPLLLPLAQMVIYLPGVAPTNKFIFTNSRTAQTLTSHFSPLFASSRTTFTQSPLM